MKKQVFLIVVGFAFCLAACKKDKVGNVSAEIREVMPQQYIDSLTQHGFKLNEEDEPADIKGIYEIKAKCDYDTYGSFPVGAMANFVKLKVQNEQGTNAELYLKGFTSTTSIDTSLKQVIAGEGDNVTIYALCKGIINTPITYNYVVTGKKTSTGLQGLKFVFIMIDNGGNANVAKNGTVRIFHDVENISHYTSEFRLANSLPFACASGN